MGTEKLFPVQMVPGAGSVPAIQRIPLPGAEMLEEEPLYVNAKQYHRILKRRQARAKLEAEGKIPKERRVRMQLGSNPGLFCENGTEKHPGWKMRVRILKCSFIFVVVHELHHSNFGGSPASSVLFVVERVRSCIADGHLL